MCENAVRVSEITVPVGLVREVVNVGSSEVRPVIWQIKLLMQLLIGQMKKQYFRQHGPLRDFDSFREGLNISKYERLHLNV